MNNYFSKLLRVSKRFIGCKLGGNEFFFQIPHDSIYIDHKKVLIDKASWNSTSRSQNIIVFWRDKISKTTHTMLLSAEFVICSTIGTVAEPALLTRRNREFPTLREDFMPFDVKFCVTYQNVVGVLSSTLILRLKMCT